MLTKTSRSRETTTLNVIACKNLLPDSKQFENILKTKSNLHVITYQTLLYYLNHQKNLELSHKKQSNLAEYEKLFLQKVMDISPQIAAVENLLFTSQLNKAKEEVREKLIQLFLFTDSQEQLKTKIQQYFTDIKSDKNTPNHSLDNYKLSYALSATNSIGIFFGAYSYADKDFFEKLASVYFHLSRIEIAESEMNLSVQNQKQFIETLNKEIRSASLADPITQLDKIFNNYKTELTAAVNGYESKKQKFIIERLRSTLKETADKFTNEYEHNIKNLVDNINSYPHSLRDTIEQALRNKKNLENLEHAKDKVINSLITIRKKQTADYQDIQLRLSKEIKNDTDSKKRLLINFTGSTESIIDLEFLPDAKQFENEILDIESKTDKSEKIFESTCRKPIIYREKINRLIEDISSFESTYPIKYEKILKEHLSNYKKFYLDFIIAAKKMGFVDKNIGKLEVSFNDQLAQILETQIPHEEQFLAQTLKDHLNTTTNQLNTAIKILHTSLQEKSASIRDLLNNSIEIETKAGKSANDAWDNTIKKLPDVLQKKITLYKTQIPKLQSQAIDILTQKTKAALNIPYQSILTDFDLKIQKINTHLKTRELDSILSEELEDDFVDTIIDNIHQERIQKELQQKMQDAKQTQKELAKAQEHERRASDGDSNHSIHAAKKARILAEEKNAQAHREIRDQETTLLLLKDTNTRSTKSPSAKDVAIGIASGFISMVLAPIAWFYGVYRIALKIKRRTASNFYAALAGFTAFCITPLGWIFGGIKIGQNAAKQSLRKKKLADIPLLSLDTTLSPSLKTQSLPTKAKPITAIKLPKISFHKMFTTICTKKSFPIKDENNSLYIQTSPINIMITENDDVYLTNCTNDIKLGYSATCLILRVLSVLNKNEDLKINIESGFMVIEINTGTNINKFFVAPGNGGDENLIYVYEKQTSNNKIPLILQQFNTDDVLKKTLYQSSLSKPSIAYTSHTNGAAAPASLTFMR